MPTPNQNITPSSLAVPMTPKLRIIGTTAAQVAPNNVTASQSVALGLMYPSTIVLWFELQE